MTEADAVELDELRAKAYGPRGGLTDAEARRLEELQALTRETTQRAPRVRSTADASTDSGADRDALLREPSDPEGSGTSGEDEPLPAESDLVETDSDSAAEPDARARPAGLRGILDRRWFPYAAVGFALVLGFGVGFAVFGQEVVRSVALSLSVAAEQTELEARGEYDPGSIRPLDRVREATIWHATRDDGERQCVIVTVEERFERACVPADQFDEHRASLYAGISLPAEEESEADGLNVNVVRASDGDLDVHVQIWTPGMWDWRSHYTEDELGIIERIEDETGVAGESLELIGYDGDRPIWVEYTGAGACIIAVVDAVERACSDHPKDPETAMLQIADDGWITIYRVSAHDLRPASLTIERAPVPGVDGTIDDTTGDIEP